MFTLTIIEKISGKFRYDPDTISQSMVEAKIETAGGILVGDEVSVSLEVQLLKEF